eukprot:11089123-Ditylum_brightwellii.AAC.1
MSEKLRAVTMEQFGSTKKLLTDLQAFNTRLIYGYMFLKCTQATSTFINLVSKYDLVVHIIAVLALQWISIPKEPINCTFTTFQDVVHTC